MKFILKLKQTIMKTILFIIKAIKNSKIIKKLNKYIKLGAIFNLLEWILSYIPISFTFRIIFWMLKILVFIVGASSIYLTSAFGRS